MPFKLCRSIYGWYLLLQFRNAFGYAHSIMGCLALQQVVSTISNKSKDLWLLKILHGKRAAEVTPPPCHTQMHFFHRPSSPAVQKCSWTPQTDWQIFYQTAQVIHFITSHPNKCTSGIFISGSLFKVASLSSISPSSFEGPSLNLTLLSAALITLITHVTLFQLSHHLHQSDIGSLLASLPKASMSLWTSLSVFLIGIEISLRSLSVTSVG